MDVFIVVACSSFFLPLFIQCLDEDSFFVLGSDGIFNHLTRQSVVDIVKCSKTPQDAANVLAISGIHSLLL
jgi:serine/threonine protein phosphatase PrpC